MKHLFGRRFAGVLTIGLAIGSGCGLTHDRSEDDVQVEQDDDCRNDRVEIVNDLAAKTRLGFSANSVLSFVEGTHSSELQWLLPVEAYDPRFAFDGLTMEVKRSGSVRLVKRPVEGTSETRAVRGARACPLALEIDAMVRLTNRNGVLDESFQAVIVAREATLAELHHEFSPEAAFYEFASRRLTAAAAVLTKLELTAQLTQSRVSGSIASEYESSMPGIEDASTLELAVWPPRDVCNVVEPEESSVPRIPVRMDSALADAPIALLNSAGPVRMVWSDGEATSLDLRATQAGVACMQRPVDGTPIFTYPMKLDATTQDGRLKAQLEGTLWVTSIVGSEEPTVAVLQTRTPIQSADELESKTGLTGVDLAGYESLVFRCSVYYAPEDGAPQGMVVLIGEPSDGDACDPARGKCGLTEILEGRFQKQTVAP